MTATWAECRDCSHFRNDAAAIAAAFPGLASFGSPDASVRAEDGICARHDRYLGAANWCRDFRRRG